MFIGIIIIILLVYFLIIRPMTQRNSQRGGYYEDRRGPSEDRRGYYNDRRGPFDDRREYYDDRRGYFDRPDYFGPPQSNPGIGRFGSFAGGIAAGALLTYLFEQGRVGFDQYQAWQGLDNQGIMRELMDQNILQEHEISQLQDEVNQRGGDGWNPSDTGNYQDDHDNDYDNPNQQDYDGFDQNNNNNDNWV